MRTRSSIRARQAHKAFNRLEPPEDMGNLTITDVAKAADGVAHIKAVNAWALSAWQAWEGHHEQVRDWTKALHQ